MKSLARSACCEILHEYEDVWLVRKGLVQPIAVGDFYGDPNCAIIDADEQWCAVGGQGLIVYFIAEPFAPYPQNPPSRQYLELGRGRDGAWWVESLEQTGPTEIRVVLESGATHRVAFTRSAEGVALQIR